MRRLTCEHGSQYQQLVIPPRLPNINRRCLPRIRKKLSAASCIGDQRSHLRAIICVPNLVVISVYLSIPGEENGGKSSKVPGRGRKEPREVPSGADGDHGVQPALHRGHDGGVRAVSADGGPEADLLQRRAV